MNNLNDPISASLVEHFKIITNATHYVNGKKYGIVWTCLEAIHKLLNIYI